MSTGSISAGSVCPESKVARSGVRRFHHLGLGVVVAAGLVAGSLQAWAQPADSGGKPGAVDKLKPKAEAKLLEHYRAKLEVKDDAEWTIIQGRLENILRAQRELQSALTVTRQTSRASDGKSSKESTKGSGHNDPGRVSDGSPESEVRALQKLVATRAPAQQLKPQLARVRDMLRDRQEKLAQAREDLRVVLSSRQEAIALLNGLLR